MQNSRLEEERGGQPGGRNAKKKEGEKRERPRVPFWEYLGGLGDRWRTEDLSLYIYRLWPTTDKRNPERYLAKLQESIDEDYLLRTFGTGKYWLVLNTKDGRTLREHVTNPYSPDHPPKVHPAEVIAGDPINSVYFETWGRKKANGAAGDDKAAPSDRSDVNQVLTTVLEKSGSFDPKLAELWEKTARERDDLSKALAAKNAPPDMLGVIKGIKELFPSPASAAPAQADMATLLRLAKELQQPPPAAPNPLELLETAKGLFSPPQDDLANIDRLLGIANKLATLRGGGGGGGGESRSGWDVGLNYVRELAPLVPYFGSMFGLRVPGAAPVPGGAPVPGAAPGATAAAPQPTVFDPYQRPNLMKQHAQTLNGAAAQAAAAPLPGAPNGSPSGDLLVTLQMYGGLVLSALNGGLPGFDFADHIVALTGTATHAMLAAHGEDGLVHAMQQIPDLALFGEPRLRQFTREFLEYEKYLQEEEAAVIEEENEHLPSQSEHASKKRAALREL